MEAVLSNYGSGQFDESNLYAYANYTNNTLETYEPKFNNTDVLASFVY
jgi:hypothetical protein